MNTQLNDVIVFEEQIRMLENKVTEIQKNFIIDNVPIHSLGDKFIINKIDNGRTFEITTINTSFKNKNFLFHTSFSLNAIFDFDKTKESNRYKSMLLAEKGLMFVYEFTECGKNGKAKKIGGVSHILTEYEIKEYINDGRLVHLHS